MQEGWICPRCGKVNAPWNPWCSCEPKQISNTNTNTSEWTPVRDFMTHPQMDTRTPTEVMLDVADDVMMGE